MQFENLSSALCTIGVWGPDARALLSTITDTPLSQAAFPYRTVRDVVIDGVPATMLRISYVGESGWEIYCRFHKLELHEIGELPATRMLWSFM